MRHQINENYFSQPTVENCYWAGYIAADGYIHNKYNRVILKCASVDREILYNFQKCTKSTHTHMFEKGGLIEGFDNLKREYYRQDQYSIHINSKQIISDLKEHWNILNRKSHTLKPPNIVDTAQKLAYIIGYFDGDGWITYCKDKKRPTIGFIMGITGNFQIVSWIREELMSLCPSLSWNDKVTSNGSVYKIVFKHRKGRTIHQALKDINLPFRLPRKWNINYGKPISLEVL